MATALLLDSCRSPVVFFFAMEAFDLMRVLFSLSDDIDESIFDFGLCLRK